MKDQLCQAFCDEIQIRDVPIGLAVSTGFDNFTGDPIGFYISGPNEKGCYQIQDDGMTIFNLESSGADLDIATRATAFEDLLREYGFSYNKDEHVLLSSPLQLSEIAAKSLRFVALLLRLQDLLLMVQEHASSTFKEEALRMLREQAKSKAEITENEPVSSKLEDYPADAVFRSSGHKPVALFFGTSDQKISEAIILDMVARYEVKIDCSVVVMIEYDASITRKVRQRAANRLAAVSYFRGDEDAAVSRIIREVAGETAH